MTNPVLAALVEARRQRAPLFARWCEREGEAFCPATPAAVARFASEHAGLGIMKLWEAVNEVSRAHLALNLADPTAGAPVALVLDDVAGLAPPRAWPATWKERFRALPHDLKTFVAEHETRREKSLRRAQNALAQANDTIARLQAATQTREDQTNETATQYSDHRGPDTGASE
ncbi:hypothetical protein [Bradyrhizobium sp. HKCCYLR20261]|uniref:hypothetical protein n=1 Tax=Bradyrhizobium sp. HKCCYLR20261 TaxID=3420760 RepID=UPI003EB88F2E